MNRVSNASSIIFKKVTHVIFDLDGVILDTESLYTKAVQNIVSKYGKTFDWQAKVQIMGLTGKEASKVIVELLELPLSWEEYYDLAKEQYKLIMPNAQLMPDTESIYKRVICNIAKAHGKEYTNEICAKLLGTVERDTANIAVNEMKLPMSPEHFLNQFKTAAMKSFDNVAFMPGAEKLIKHFHGTNVPIAIATSSNYDSFDIKSQKHKELFSLFSHIVTGGSDPEVGKGKPAPDIFLVCASRFKDRPQPDQCLVFEDAPNGVTAAVSAGMQVVMIPDKQITGELCKHATLKIDTLEKMRPELFGLPKFH